MINPYYSKFLSSYLSTDLDLKESFDSYLDLMESFCTAAIVVPAMLASTGFSKEMHNLSLPFSGMNDEVHQALPSLYAMKQYQAGANSALINLIKTSCNLAEQYWRMSPITALSAYNLALLQSLREII
jgi:hypothetical protein